jgi:uncharacterized protein (TIGR00369 family)
MENMTINDNHCFCCGTANTSGLKLQFKYPAKGQALSELVIPAYFAGWKNITHGGLLSMLLDEIMAHACGSDGIWALTAELTVRFLKPVRVGERISIQGSVVEKKSRLIKAEGVITDSKGVTIAKGTGSFLASSPPKKEDS